MECFYLNSNAVIIEPKTPGYEMANIERFEDLEAWKKAEGFDLEPWTFDFRLFLDCGG
jgi:hypothetical protein